MSSKRIKVNVDLDFTTGKVEKEDITKQIQSAVDAVRINLDPQDAKEFEKEFKRLGELLTKHLNEATGKVNTKGLMAELNNDPMFLSLDELSERYRRVGVDGAKSFKQVQKENDIFAQELSKTNSTLSKMGDTLKNTIRWNISASVVNKFSGEMQKAYYFSKDLDRVLTDIRIVTGKSANEMSLFAEEANNAAKNLNTTTREYSEAATLFFQQGLADQEVQNMTEAAIMSSQLTGIATEEMANLLTSTLNGYRMATEEVTSITDKFSAVGATTASDFGELSVAMSKVASMANTAGVPLDNLTAQLATIMSVTREAPETVGTALKTIYGRMVAFRTDTKSVLKDEDGELFSAPQVEAALKAYSKATGAQISLFKTAADGSKQLRDMHEVLEDIGKTWDLTSDKAAKFGLTTALAGTRQQNQLIALFENWEMYEEAVETALNSEGTTLQQNEAYMDSYEAKLKGLQAAKEGLYMAALDPDHMKGFIEGLTSVINLTTVFVDSIGGLPGVLGLVGAAFSTNIVEGLSKGAILAKELQYELKQSTSNVDMDEMVKARELLTIKKIMGEEVAKEKQEELQLALAREKTSKITSEQYNRELQLMRDMHEIWRNAKSEEEAYQKSRAVIASEHATEIIKERENLDLLLEKQKELAELERRRKEINQEADGGFLPEGLVEELEIIEEKTKDIEDSTSGIFRKAYDNAKLSEEAWMQTGEAAETASNNIERLAEESQKASQAAEVVAGIMMVMPGVISNAKDMSQGWGETLSGIGKALLPLILSQVGKLVSQFVALKTTGAAMTMTVGSFLGPIGAAAAGAVAVTAAIRGIKSETQAAEIAMENFKATTEELHSTNSELKEMESQLGNIAKRRKDIQDQLRNTSNMDSDTVNKLRQENRALGEKEKHLKRELYIKELTVKQLKKQAELEATILKNTKSKSSVKEGIFGWATPKVTPEQEIERLKKAITSGKSEVEKYEQQLRSLNEEYVEGVDDADKYAKKKDEIIEKLREAQEQTDEYYGEFINKLNEFKDSMNGIEDTEVGQEMGEIVDSMIEWIELNVPEYASDLAFGMEDVADSTWDATNQMIEFLGTQYDLTDSTEELTYTQDVLLEAMEELIETGGFSEEVYLALIGIHEDFINVAELEEDQVWELLEAHFNKAKNSIDNEINQEQAVIESVRARINAYGAEAEALKNLARVGAGPAGELGPDGNTTYGRLGDPETIATAQRKINSLKNLKGSSSKKYRNLVNKRDRERKRDKPSRTPRTPRKKTPKKTQKKKQTKKSESKKNTEEKLAEADAYERINLLIDRNNSLIALNSARMSNLVAGSQTHLKAIDTEIKLQKERQKLLHEKNEQLREEGRQLQKELSHIFKFEGSWDNNNVMIKNMEDIEGKSEEVEQQFKRVIEIMKELPSASTEWWQIKKQIEDLEIEKMVLYFEKINKGLDYYTDAISDIDYRAHMADQDDFVSQTGYLAEKIEMLDKQSKVTELALDNLVNKYPPGTISAQEFAEKQKELTQRLKETNMELKDQERALEELIETEKQAARERAVEAKNAELQAKRDKIAAIEETQEIVVEIIRKRGEEERRLAEKAHEEELARLEERRKAKEDAYQDEYDAYRKLIEDKLKALDDQFREEDYREQLAKEQAEAARLQREIDILSLDDSLTAKNKRADLRKQLSDQIEKIEKMERDRSRENMRKALEDELDNYEKTMDDKRDKDEEDYENELELLEKNFEDYMEYLDKKYSNANVYAEAAQALIEDQVLTAKGAYQSISDAHEDFQKEFGAGMGLLGEMIQNDFIAQLYEARDALVGINAFSLSHRPREDYTTDEISDSELYNYGYKDPKLPGEKWNPTPRPPEFVMPVYWRDEDFNKYVENKKKWEQTKDPYEKARLNAENMRLRAYYWGEDMKHKDLFTWKDLKGYKDGGIIDSAGLFVGHGSTSSSEVVFSAKTAKKLWEYIENLPDFNDSLQGPRIVPTQVINQAERDYNIIFEIENMDQNILPEVEEMITRAIQKSEEDNIKTLNKAGIFKSV